MTTEALDGDQRAGVTIAGKPSFTIDQAAARLDRADLTWTTQLGTPTVVTYAYRASAPAHMPDDTTGFTQFSSAQIDATERALKEWGDVANITFQRVGAGDSGGGAYSNNATILFGGYTSGESGSSAFAYLPGDRSSGASDGDVWVNSSLRENTMLGDNQYGFLTLVHEIGHTIGLSHPSDYDASENGAALTYRHDASYYEDSVEYSVMSYFDAVQTGSNIENFLDAPGGPLIDDIAAAQRLYGANLATSTGDTVYGDPAIQYGTAPSDAYLINISGPVWGTIWDGGGVDTLDFDDNFNDQKIDLRPGSFSDVGGAIGDLSIAAGTIIENAIGGSGNDTLIGNDAGNILRGMAGDDLLSGGIGDDTYVGGFGADRAILGGNTHDYTVIDGGATGLILHGINGSGDFWIDPSTEIVQFQNGQYLSLGDVHAYVAAADTGGASVQLAPIDGESYLNGTSGGDRLYLDANAGDYVLSRDLALDSRTGDFILTARHGDSIIHVSEAIDRIDFANGQYLALADLPHFVAGNPVLALGGAQDDLLYQTRPTGYQFFDGGAGTDTVYLDGNAGDYTVRDYAGASAVDNAPSSGLELVSDRGGGALLIDDSVEIVHFLNGQYLALGDVAAYVAPAAPALADQTHFFPELGVTQNVSYSDGPITGSGVLLLNANAADFTLSREGGTFNLHSSGLWATVSESIDLVQFANGQYLSLKDLGAYVSGSDVYADATGTGDVDDLLFAGHGGDQYLIGAGGTDQAYIYGNIGDYMLRSVSNVAVPSPASGNTETLTGYELVADNGSGTIYVDQSTDAIHFQNGQYLAFANLPDYIHGFG